MITLQNDAIAVTLMPDFGARITALTDLASGRQWLVPGACTGSDIYGAGQACGWDECFPTVAPCDHPAWGGRLRDHGMLWGRAWRASSGPDSCTATYYDPRFTFTRILRIAGPCLTADYRVTNRTHTTLPYVWSQHCLLATTPADRITLSGITDLQADGQPVHWPTHGQRDLSIIGAQDDGFALKAYGLTPGLAQVAVAGPYGGISFEWTGAQLPAFGLWLDYGGWPAGQPLHQVALEPTTAPAADLAQAKQAGFARDLAPGEAHTWQVRTTMTPASKVAHG